MFSFRPSHRATKPGDRMRMKPARQKRSGACGASAEASAASNPARSAPKGRWSTTAVARPIAAALPSPAAAGSFDRTRTGRAGWSPTMLCTSATIFETLPKIRIATRTCASGAPGVVPEDAARIVQALPLPHLAQRDHRLARRPQELCDLAGPIGRNDQDKPDPGIEGPD